MHELLAVCLLTVDRDSLERPRKETGDKQAEAMLDTLDRLFVEHDAFEIFMAIMKPAKAFYEWKQEEGPVSVYNISTMQAASGHCAWFIDRSGRKDRMCRHL